MKIIIIYFNCINLQLYFTPLCVNKLTRNIIVILIYNYSLTNYPIQYQFNHIWLIILILFLFLKLKIQNKIIYTLNHLFYVFIYNLCIINILKVYIFLFLNCWCIYLRILYIIKISNNICKALFFLFELIFIYPLTLILFKPKIIFLLFNLNL